MTDSFSLTITQQRLANWAGLLPQAGTAHAEHYESSSTYPILLLSGPDSHRLLLMANRRSSPQDLRSQPFPRDHHIVTPPVLHSAAGSFPACGPCLIPAQSCVTARGNPQGSEELYSFSQHSQELFAIAGMYERSANALEGTTDYYNLFTASPVMMRPFLTSFPAIVAAQDYARWLTWDGHSQQIITDLLHPLPSSELKNWLCVPYRPHFLVTLPN